MFDFFFFKQKTAYEMRISDWSSDVCSSDLRLVHDPRRNADDRCARRHFLDDDRVRADARVRSDGEWPEDLGAGADHDAIAQRRMSLALVPADTAERHAVIEGDVLADLRSFTNDHAHAVIDEKAPPDARARMNLDASEPARQID